MANHSFKIALFSEISIIFSVCCQIVRNFSLRQVRLEPDTYLSVAQGSDVRSFSLGTFNTYSGCRDLQLQIPNNTLAPFHSGSALSQHYPKVPLTYYRLQTALVICSSCFRVDCTHLTSFFFRIYLPVMSNIQKPPISTRYRNLADPMNRLIAAVTSLIHNH